MEANARTLVAHEDSGYREWGAGGSVRLDPGASGRGLSLTLAPVWGAVERRGASVVGARAWRAGARWQVAPDVTLGLEGTRNEAANDNDPPQHGLMLRGAIRW